MNWFKKRDPEWSPEVALDLFTRDQLRAFLHLQHDIKERNQWKEEVQASICVGLYPKERWPDTYAGAMKSLRSQLAWYGAKMVSNIEMKVMPDRNSVRFTVVGGGGGGDPPESEEACATI